jgi:hypothetical protein
LVNLELSEGWYVKYQLCQLTERFLTEVDGKEKEEGVEGVKEVG